MKSNEESDIETEAKTPEKAPKSVKTNERIQKRLEFARSEVDPISNEAILKEVREEINELGYEAIIDLCVDYCFLGGESYY